MSERVVVLGAGAGGTMVANRLDRELGGFADIVVVDRTPTHHYQPAFYLHPFGHADIDDHSRDVRDYLRDDVTFREATVTGIDPDDRTVATSQDTLAYDRLVVALGHETGEGPWAGVPHVYPFYQPEGARALRETLVQLVEGDTVTGEAEPNLPTPTLNRPLRVVVTEPEGPVSCGGAPAKAALLADDYLSEHDIPCEVTLAGPDDHVFGTGKKARYDAALTEIFAERGVGYEEEFTVADVSDGRIESDDGRTLAYDLFLPVSPQRCPAVLTDHSPLTGASEDGYVAVDPETMRHREYDRVYALGDCTDVPTSKTAAAARTQAAALADNLTADATNREYEATYDGFAACPLLTEEGEAILAAYDYDGAIFPAVESRLSWLADVEAIPRLYWQVWLRGYLLGV